MRSIVRLLFLPFGLISCFIRGFFVGILALLSIVTGVAIITSCA